MVKKLICPSMMCANFSYLAEEVRELDQAGTDIFHVDIMDGAFVPNFGMGLQDLQLIRKITDKLVDVHLMFQNPSQYVEMFADIGAGIIYIHPEADLHAVRTLDKIKLKGKKVGIAINPGTSLAMVSELLPLIDYLLVMTVNPGFAGQKYIVTVDQKIEQLVKLEEKHDYEIVVDGAITKERVNQLNQKGVNGFVLGTSELFQKEQSYQDIISAIRGETK